ncbi:S-adenosyl methyltransferase [Herbihabitans rhizosphaerae]|uniref:S-adenosyl methyltransferase n=1 Tax=Herbihabitans rhizosphaerae TaxID=1872711 RepID=A0A4Q7KHM3_9PSEU|nr:SAM-dependent methyltransferase [Herbihabitans rhizosphaerae]RZS34401.1 S-adenosyl methyltransferase [Herbihabitans rhizosphaerae]
MTDTPSWVPDGVNTEQPSAARVYDYLLGGGHNFAGDRALADNLVKVVPARDMARLNRAFLRRAVVFLVESGVKQFIDLGSGIPTVGNVHEIAQQADPSCKVVYVDYEPVAVAHSELILEGNDNATIIQADMTQPDAVMNDPKTKRLINFDEPVGLLMVGVVQFVPDEADPWAVADRYREVLPDGSYFALSAFTSDNAPEGMKKAVEVFAKSQDPIFPRTHEEIQRMFGDFELVEPGLVYTPEWRPERADEVGDDAKKSNLYAGVAQKR